jgi:hypothetical protein
VPFFLFLGRRMCIVHGVLQILFQVGHPTSGTHIAPEAQLPHSFH